MPPERSSSNDLLLEQLQELLRERQRDMAEGLTLRSLSRAVENNAIAHQRSVEAHSAHDERVAQALEERVRILEAHAARSEAHVEMGTGRFNIPPVSVNVDQTRHSKRPSIPTVASVLHLVKSPAVQWIAIALIAASHILTRCGVAPVQVAPVPTQTHQ
jgi:hypothetical protein